MAQNDITVTIRTDTREFRRELRLVHLELLHRCGWRRFLTAEWWAVASGWRYRLWRFPIHRDTI